MWLKDGCTWDMHRGGWEVSSRTGYILVTDSRLFQNVAVRDMLQNIDQYLVLGCHRGADPAAHLSYLGKRTRFHITPPATPEKADHIFAELWRDTPNPP